LESSHQAQVTTLEHKLTELQKSRDEFERNERNKQRDFDNVLLEAKKQREHEEMAKVEALNELLLERQRCTDLQQKMSELEQRLLELQSARQTELVNNLPTIQMNQPPLSDRNQNSVHKYLFYNNR
jgi:chromosome segregation ATPase